MREQIGRITRGEVLSEEQAYAAMRTMMSGAAAPAHIAAFAAALAARGASVDELTGAARAARDHAVPVPFGPDVLDTCGTGGDGLDTFNISTAAAIVAAAGGARVAKHGNRASSSGCGSADVLEELGVRVEGGPDDAPRCLSEAGIAFLYAPSFHPAFGHIAPVRRELGVRTVFNLLGPLCNPARARYVVLGVPAPALVAPMAAVLSRLGVERGLVFHAEDGMDELSTGAPSTAALVEGGGVRPLRIDPAELGLAPSRPADLAGGGRAASAAVITGVLAGRRGPARDVVLLNAAAGLWIRGLATSLADGLGAAAHAVDSGAAAGVLDRLAAASWDRTLAGTP
ncbi:anthranilate phosphoribosyltransferase [Nocardiopsis mwathae]|uniref:Anthranilate phosphoribosyltransferase n=1 Tax=Nocardiopsis mwathae TaxID=1472723 RepID=A0A7W9YNX6_9ACTN|nr:anthranilate phosphoribosyltransferase [Nocardiopsis mwathae]MBB6174551.1 anthranilate phosphoribosyltransferase [Nocardiopsis mwathae]